MKKDSLQKRHFWIFFFCLFLLCFRITRTDWLFSLLLFVSLSLSLLSLLPLAFFLLKLIFFSASIGGLITAVVVEVVAVMVVSSCSGGSSAAAATAAIVAAAAAAAAFVLGLVIFPLPFRIVILSN